LGAAIGATAATFIRQINPNLTRHGQTIGTMKSIRAILKFVALGFAVAILFFLVARVSSHHSLTVDILGSYFPAWMVCIVSGLTLTLIAHWIVQLGNLKRYIGPAPLIYSCLMIIFTFATWILFYQN